MTCSRSVTELAQRLFSARRITILTGAGVSAESGIATFRDAGGLWEGHRVEEVATPEAFVRNPDLVYAFYNLRRAALELVGPNAGHHALVDMVHTLGANVTLITQNVDDLHERAGSDPVLHMHGELKKARCLRCLGVFEWTENLDATSRCPSCAGQLRPHIVWFGELPFYMEREIPAALACDVFMAVGTSGLVYPAAGFAWHAKRQGAFVVEVNLHPSDSASFDLVVTGPSGQVLPELVQRLR